MLTAENVTFQSNIHSVRVMSNKVCFAYFSKVCWLIKNCKTNLTLVKADKFTNQYDYLYFIGSLHEIYDISIPDEHKLTVDTNQSSLIKEVHEHNVEIRKCKSLLEIWDGSQHELLANYALFTREFNIFDVEYVNENEEDDNNDDIKSVLATVDNFTNLNKLSFTKGLFSYMLKQYYNVKVNMDEFNNACVIISL